MRVGVYNLYWATFGGGEQQAACLADVLAAEHEVELIGHTPVDLDEIRDRTNVALPGATFRTCDRDREAATRVSAEYDLFVNHCYRSTAMNAARLGLYSVMFPQELAESRAGRLLDRVGRSAERSIRLQGRFRSLVDRVALEGAISLQVPMSASSVQLRLGSDRAVDVEIVVVGRDTLVERHVASVRTEIDVHLPEGHHGEVVVVPMPCDGTKERHEGVWLEAAVVDRGAGPELGGRLARRIVAPRRKKFLDTYQRVVAISPYTLMWTQRRWERGDVAIFPPVQLRQPGVKERLIVTLGRFFDPRRGHSKCQLEMVEAFRQLLDAGVEGWRLVVIGGCQPEDRDYAMAVRRAAEGLPVEVRMNAPRHVVDDHLARASLYWHAAGLGSDLEAHPDRAEHFGIAPIEAMSAGAVPLVFGEAGPKDVVEHEVSGFHFRTIEELVRLTEWLIADEARRSTVAAAAVRRAEQFDSAHFADRIRRLVDDMVDEDRDARRGPPLPK